MSDEQVRENQAEPIPFKAETRQLLNILIHSLYTDREIFLRELISNASDALTRINFELLTNRDVLDADSELTIHLTIDKEAGTLTVSDNGIGMTMDELGENLGTIAHSGARAFVEAYQRENSNLNEIIGQFGVGFYSAFMVADWIRVNSRSLQRDSNAAAWFSDGSDTFSLHPAEKDRRGTDVVLKLKEDAKEFLDEYRLRDIIRKHSDYVPFPIYIGESQEQANRQSALWRENPRQVESKDYEDFYHQLTLDPDAPLAHAHMVVDAPVQMYALLYMPHSPEHHIFSARKQDGLKLYSRKVLIQDYCTDLLPEYLGFVQGVVDSEDLPLNVARETVQSNRIMANLKKLVTGKVLDALHQLAKEDAEKFNLFWNSFSRYIKQGVALELNEPERLHPLLQFHTNLYPETWSSLDDYVERMRPGQSDIYYILGDDERSIRHSPHLDLLGKRPYEALLLTDPLDSFVMVRLNEYKGHKLVNVADPDLELPKIESEAEETAAAEATPETSIDMAHLIERFKRVLGEHVSEVKLTDRLTDAPARLVDPKGAPNPEMQRVYRLLNKDFEAPKKVLELNRNHPILLGLNSQADENTLGDLLIEQIYENALLIEGLHPDPASMISRVQEIMKAALDNDSS